MSILADQACQAQRDELALLEAATARGDLAATVAEALLAGRVLYVLADGSQGPLATQIADAVGQCFGSPVWPPVVALTPDTRLLALVGSDHRADRPLAEQAELLVRPGDVVMVLTDGQPGADLTAAADHARSQGAAVAGLGLPPSGLEADPAIGLPEAPPARLAACQLALGQALAGELAARLPAEPPDADPAMVAFPCTNCAAALAVVRHLAGRRGVCPHCYNNTILAPDHADNEHRAHLRFALRECALAVALAPPDKPLIGLPGQIALENISPGGLLFGAVDCPLELRPGDHLVIELTTPAFKQPVELSGTVNRVTREAARHVVGVVFADCSAAALERLRVLERNLVLRNLAARPD